MDSPGLTFAFVLSVGVAAQLVAHYLRIPGVVLLLSLGVALGPDGLGIVSPTALSGALPTLVEFGVAVILFTGGMNLRVDRLLHERKAIRRLVSLGALITAAGGALTARLILEWDWSTSVLFGTIVIVTGPTVVNPLLRRLRVERSVATILEAEGLLGEALGAVAAVVVLETLISPTGTGVIFGPVGVLGRLGFGLAFGGLSGLVIGRLLKAPHVVPRGFENIFVLSSALLVFQVADALVADTGIPAVAAAGAVVGNLKGIRVQRELLEFKEQLTVMLLGLLFILLAADMRLANIYAVGWAGVVAVALLVFVLRPVAVFASTWGCEVTLRQKLFMSWMGPRGIVAGAVASAFAARLAQSSQSAASELTALVFLLITASVVSAGIFGGLVGRMLRVRSDASGWIILGANALAREVARTLRPADDGTICIDSSRSACALARHSNIPVVHGDALDEKMLHRANIEQCRGALAITPNQEVNYLFIKRVRETALLEQTAVTLTVAQIDKEQRVGRDQGSETLFGGPQDVNRWCSLLDRDAAVRQAWRPAPSQESRLGVSHDEWSEVSVLFLGVRRDQHVAPVTSSTRFRKSDVVEVLLDGDRLDKACARLKDCGWIPMARDDVPERAHHHERRGWLAVDLSTTSPTPFRPRQGES